ncbi:MAG TPA: DUF6483 family protein [Candidatus Acidoferrum sp.]|nr:DUF6483 family protein [Candidatus Acidoferrum sp.]
MSDEAHRMIRRDYILRMIEEFIQVLSRINSLKRGLRWQEADEELDTGLQRLVSAGAEAVSRMGETELLARLIQGEPTQVVHHKALLLTTLLKEAGDVAVAQDRVAEGRACYVKGLNLLLDTLARGEAAEFPEFVPKVEVFAQALQDAPLPLDTQARLMQHYERLGEFGKAEDALFAMLEAEPREPQLLEFGMGFYRRLSSQSDAALSVGNLPRPELQAGLAELERRRAALPK